MADRVLVTGSDGFVGTHLVRALELEGFGVLQHSHGDGDLARCELAYDGVAHVCHLAARTYVPDSWQRTRDFYETNVLGTINVLEFCRRHTCSLSLMSSYVYGRPQYLPIAEDHPLEAFNPYAHTKILAEEAARFYAVQFGLTINIIRPFNLYGAGQGQEFLIPTLIAQALAPGDTITVADARPKRDFLHVDDLVRLLQLTIRRRPAGVFNAGSGVSVSIGELVELINQYLPVRKSLISAGRVRDNEVMDTVADCSKALHELGWAPQVTLAAGIGELVADAALSVSSLGRQ